MCSGIVHREEQKDTLREIGLGNGELARGTTFCFYSKHFCHQMGVGV
jgi:hypothetical protein